MTISRSSLGPRTTVSTFGGTSVTLPSRMESRLYSSLGGGHSIPGTLQSQMEGAFGQSFSDVRLHTDSSAAEMSRSIGAKAFTYRNDIFFNQGQFDPQSFSGQHLIAHELAHVVQGSGVLCRETGDLQAADGQSDTIELDYVKDEELLFDVIDALISPSDTNKTAVFSKPPLKGKRLAISNPKTYEIALVFIWHWLHERVHLNDEQSLAVLGNWDHESGLDPARVEGLLDRDSAAYGVLDQARVEQLNKTLFEIYTEDLTIKGNPIDTNEKKTELLDNDTKVRIIRKKKNKIETYPIDGEIDNMNAFWWVAHKDGGEASDKKTGDAELKRWIISIKKDQRFSLAGVGIGQWTGNRMWHPRRGLSGFISKRGKILEEHFNLASTNDLKMERFFLISQLAFAKTEKQGKPFNPGDQNDPGIWYEHTTDKGYKLDTPLKQFMYHFEGVASDDTAKKREEAQNKVIEKLRALGELDKYK